MASINSIGILQTKFSSKPIYSTGKLKNLNTLNSVVNSCKSNTLERKHMSLDTLNNAIKMHDNKNGFIRKNEHFKESLANDTIVENKLQKSNMEKTEHNAVKTHKTGNQSSLINIQNKNQILRPVTFIESKRVMRNQFLKTHVSETLFEENENPEYTNLQKIQNAGNKYVNSKEHNGNNIHIEETVNVKNRKFQKSLPSFLSDFKFARDSYEKIDKKSENIFNTQNDELYIISEDKQVKENKKNIADSLRSLTDVDESAEDTSDNVPPIIEKEAATLEKINSRSRYLGIDMATSNFIAAYHFTKRKFLKKLKDKGLAITQNELSLCDMTNRRKFYNQQHFINKQRWCIDKCTGL